MQESDARRTPIIGGLIPAYRERPATAEEQQGEGEVLNVPHDTVVDYARCALAVIWLAATAVMYVISQALHHAPPNVDMFWWMIGFSLLTLFASMDMPPAVRAMLMQLPTPPPPPPAAPPAKKDTTP